MKRLSLILIVLVYSVSAAQEGNEIMSTIERFSFNFGSFAIAVISGVILSVAFQLLFTNLSVAAGLSAAGPAIDKLQNSEKSRDKNEESTSIHSSIRKLSGAFGVWTMVSAGLSLFFAIWIAVTLSVTTSGLLGALTGLVIWGLFYVITMTLETSAVSSLVGTLFGVAGKGFRTAFEGTKSVFSKSEEKRAADITAEITETVKKELFSDIDTDDLKEQINKYVYALKPKELKPEQIRKELENFLDDVDLQAIVEAKGDLLQDEEIEASLKRKRFNRKQAKSTVRNIREGINILKEERRKSKSKAEAALDTGFRLAGMSSSEAEENRNRIENYLRNTGKDELNPDGIKRDLEKMFSDPKEGTENLKERLKGIDKDTIAAVISQRSDISEDEARQKIESIERTISGMVGKATDAKDKGKSTLSDRASMITESAQDGVSNYKEKTKAKIEDFIDHISNPEFNYDDISRDIQRIFSGEVKQGSRSMLQRLKSIDRETIKDVISYRDDISEEDAERIISNIESKRDEYIHKAEEFTEEVKRRVDSAKKEALHQADEIRKTAASAAWWAAATAGVSAVAAVLGGLIGTI